MAHQATPRDLFSAVRRVYRVTSRVHVHHDADTVAAHVAAVRALRALTGRWDLCEPVTRWGQMYRPVNPRHWHIQRPVVYASCTRWLRAH